MHVLFASLVFASVWSFASAIDVEGRIAWNEVCKDYSELGHSVVALDDGRYRGGIKRDGSFSIPDVNEGSYILSVLSHDFTFDTLRVDVPTKDAKPDIRPYVPGTPHNPPSSILLPYPITLAPRNKNVYFVERETFNVLGMLRNPMVLMMVGMGVLLLGMPYIMKNLDPELATEVRERQAKLVGVQNSLQSGDIRGSLSALLAPDSTSERDTVSQTTNNKKANSGSSTARPKSTASGKAKRR